MKKIFVFVICAIALASCGTANKIENNPYFADAYGYSEIDKDIAYENAYVKAMSKISEKFNIEVKTEGRETYEGTSIGKNSNEIASRSHDVKTASKVNVSDIIVENIRYSKSGGKYECYLTVRIAAENLK